MTPVRHSPDLADPQQAAGHFTELISRIDPISPTVVVTFVGADAHPLVCIQIVDCDIDATASECAEVLTHLVGDSGDPPPPDSRPMLAGLALGLTRPGGEAVQDYDRSWLRALYRVCHQARLRPYGVYSVTRGRARQVTIDDAA